MTMFSSGISMYAMGGLLDVLLGWDFYFSVLVSAVIVLSYVSWAGSPAPSTTRCCSSS